MDAEKKTLSIEERVARLEGKLGWARYDFELSEKAFVASLVVSVLAFGVALKGLGFPNHAYQMVLAILAIALGYHRNWLVLPQKWYHWSLAAVDAAVLSLLFKLVIGSGKRFPFFWALVPSISSEQAKEGSKWLQMVPRWNIDWQPSPLAEWSWDLTVVQTFLLLITLIGALFEFQPFISLTALLLILVSLPAFVTFDWPWVFPAIILASIGLYLQSTSARIGDE